MLLTGHKGRAYNIIHEQELLDAGDQLVAYLAQQPQAAPPLRLVPRGARPQVPRLAAGGRHGPDPACVSRRGNDVQ